MPRPNQPGGWKQELTYRGSVIHDRTVADAKAVSEGRKTHAELVRESEAQLAKNGTRMVRDGRGNPMIVPITPLVQSKSSTTPGNEASAGSGEKYNKAQERPVTYTREASDLRQLKAKMERTIAQRNPGSKMSGGSGQGRGNWGHQGRPGERGGSA